LRRHHHEPVSTDLAQTADVYVCSKCGLQFEHHDTYQCHDAEQHTDIGPMQLSTSASTGQQQQATAGGADSIDSQS